MSNQRRFALIGRGFGSDTFDEYAQDLTGALFVDSSEVNFTYNDATPSLTAALIDASITFARLQNFDALSVLGRSANSSGVGDEIAAAANDRLLARTSNSLAFQQLTVGMAPDAVWTFAKLQNFDALSVLGRSANSSGVGDEIAAAADGDVLNRNGTSLVFGQTFTGALKFANATTAIELESVTPRILFDDTNAGSDQRLTGFAALDNQFVIRTRTDADATGENIINWQRSGTVLTSIGLGDSGVGDFSLELSTNSMAANFKTTSGGSFTIQALDGADGAFASCAFVASGGETIFLVAANAATSAPIVTGGPTGSQLLLDVEGGNLVFSVGFVATGLMSAARLEWYNPIRFPRYTVATLPAGAAGDRAQVTDALAPAFGAAVAGGGAAIVPVYYTGAAWFVG